MPLVVVTHAVPRDVATASAVIRLAVVIDFGARSEVSPRVIIKCLKVPAGINGAEVLASVASSFRIPAPTYASSGLLCSIGGYPSTGCGTSEHGGFAYWSYWHGGNQWSYASIGPAAWTTRNGDVEGWRFQNPGSASPADPPPTASSVFAQACAAAAVSPAPAPRRGDGHGSTTLFAAATLIALALGAAGAVRWRRRTGT